MLVDEDTDAGVLGEVGSLLFRDLEVEEEAEEEVEGGEEGVGNASTSSSNKIN